MSITIGRYGFEGPYHHTGSLEDRSGVYAILCHSYGNYAVIDVGESATVRTRVENHDRAGCWSRNCYGTLMVAVCYTPYLQQAGRQVIESELRQVFAPACGVR